MFLDLYLYLSLYFYYHYLFYYILYLLYLLFIFLFLFLFFFNFHPLFYLTFFLFSNFLGLEIFLILYYLIFLVAEEISLYFPIRSHNIYFYSHIINFFWCQLVDLCMVLYDHFHKKVDHCCIIISFLVNVNFYTDHSDFISNKSDFQSNFDE